jgi:hypothetical protein
MLCPRAGTERWAMGDGLHPFDICRCNPDNTVMSIPEPGRFPRVVAAVATFLCLSGVLLALTLYLYLIPAAAAVEAADARGRQQLAAVSALVLTLLLVVLLALLVIIFRPGRMWLPGKSPPRTRTTYIDAWAEAGRRAAAPSPDDLEQGEGEQRDNEEPPGRSGG